MKKFPLILAVILFVHFVSSAQTNNQKNILVCWDASFSMKDRDIEKELQFLQLYLQQKDKSAQLLVTVFSDKIISETKYALAENDIATVRGYLSNVVNDGVASYSLIEPYSDKVFDAVLLFTDGNQVLDKLPKFSKANRLIIVNSSEGSNNKDLVAMMGNENTFYIDLFSFSPDVAIDSLINNIKSFFTAEAKKRAIQSIRKMDFNEVYGVTYYYDKILPNAAISVEGTNRYIISDSLGNYKIEASQGDKLIFNHLGLKAIKLSVKNKPNIDVNFKEKIVALDEVEVVAKKEEKIQVMTSTGLRDANSIGYSVATISEEAGTEDIEIGASLAGKTAGLKIGAGDNPGQRSNVLNASDMLIRGLTSATLNSQPMVVVDGTPVERSQLADLTNANRADYGFIDPGNIKSISVLKSLAGTTKYGTEGRNGVILITTKTGQGFSASQGGTTYDDTKRMLGIDNDYIEKKALKTDIEIKAKYIDRLKKTNSLKEAYNVYLSIRDSYYKDPHFFMDVHDYFNQFQDKSIAKRILSNIFELFKTDDVALKQLGLKLEETKDHEFLLKVYQQVKILQPNSTNTYLDLATAYKNLGNYKEALNNYEYLIAPENASKFKYSELRKIVISEIKNLFYLHKSEVNSASAQTFYLHNSTSDARIVFNWSNPDINFQVDFVDPNNKFFKWSYEPLQSAKRIEEDKTYGLTSEEFQLIGAEKGNWKLNLKYLGLDNKKRIPAYLQIKVYHNFGKSNQNLETKLVRLEKVGTEINLINIHIK